MKGGVMGWTHDMIALVQWLLMHTSNGCMQSRLIILESYLIDRSNR